MKNIKVLKEFPIYDGLNEIGIVLTENTSQVELNEYVEKTPNKTIDWLVANGYLAIQEIPKMRIRKVDYVMYEVLNVNDIVINNPNHLTEKVLNALKENNYDVRYTSNYDYRTNLIDECTLNDKKTDAYPVKLLIIPIN